MDSQRIPNGFPMGAPHHWMGGAGGPDGVRGSAPMVAMERGSGRQPREDFTEAGRDPSSQYQPVLMNPHNGLCDISTSRSVSLTVPLDTLAQSC